MMPVSRSVLTLNTGSSSLKAALYEVGADATELFALTIEDVGQAGKFPDHGAATTAVLELLAERNRSFSCVAHRIVQGGPAHTAPIRIDAALLNTLQRLSDADPEHGPGALAAIRCVQQHWPDLPQLACFDTAFHCSLPAVAQRFALPERFFEQGLKRYGFHGLSYESVLESLRRTDPDLAQGRVIIAHLGNGASMAALRAGACVETSMGFTPQSGLMMGTRAGDIDSGVLLQLLGTDGMDVPELRALLHRQSGLLGVSQHSADMRELLRVRSDDPRAAFAIDLFCHQVRKFLGAYVAVLGGLDALVFTGGIGEHAWQVRAQVCADLSCFGIVMDAEANRAGAAALESAGSPVALRVIASDEGRMLALHAGSVLGVAASA